MIPNESLSNRREQFYFFNNDAATYPVNWVPHQSQVMIPDPLNNIREQVNFLNNNGIPNQSQVLISHQS